MTKRAWLLLTKRAKGILVRRNPGAQAKVSRKLGVSDGLVSRVWWGKATSARVLDAILKAVKS